MKDLFCAECGERIRVLFKSVKAHGKVYRLIYPHNCGEISEEISEETISKIAKNDTKGSSPIDFDAIFGKFKFVQKLNKLTPKPEETEETGDKRDGEHLRKELKTSSAPINVLDGIRALNEED